MFLEECKYIVKEKKLSECFLDSSSYDFDKEASEE